MKKLEPPIAVPLGHDLALHVTHVEPTKGLPRARCALWNGTIRAIDTIDPSSQPQRQRFVKAAMRAEPALAEDELDFALLMVAESLASSQGVQRAAEAPNPAIRQAEQELLAAPLLAAPDLLRRARCTIQALGLVGEERTALAMLLAATTRLLAEPVSVVVKGPSGGGKSFTTKTVLATLPEEAFVDYTTVSPKFLSYDTTPIKHRIVVLMEAPGLGSGDTPSGEATAYVARSLISEGRIVTGTVERAAEGAGLEAHTIVREGPAALWTTTTKAKLDDELETRLLSFAVRDDTEQTRRVMGATAARYAGAGQDGPDLSPWHAVQAVLQATAAGCEVVNPLAGELAEQVDASHVRARRDFGKLLALIAASAVLHQRQRGRDAAGRIVVDLADYRHVYSLLAATFTATAASGLTPTVRETVQTVAAMVAERGEAVTVRQVAERLGLDRSAVQYRIAAPLREGWLVDEHEGHRGKRRLLRAGEELPGDRCALPHPDELGRLVPGCAGVPWFDALGEDGPLLPPDFPFTPSHVGPTGASTRGDAAPQRVNPPVNAAAGASQDAPICEGVKEEQAGDSHVADGLYQEGTAATCEPVKGIPGESAGAAPPENPRPDWACRKCGDRSWWPQELPGGLLWRCGGCTPPPGDGGLE